jgi:hypothetical protein
MVHGSQYHRMLNIDPAFLTNAQIHFFCKTSVFLKGFLTVETIWKLASDFSLICELTIDRSPPCSFHVLRNRAIRLTSMYYLWLDKHLHLI